MAELGSTVVVTFHFPVGATVNVQVTDPNNVTADPIPVPEGDAGEYPFTITLDIEGTWRIVGSDSSTVDTNFFRADVPETPLATLEDFETQTETELTPAEAAHVEYLLLAISSDVRDFTGKPYPDSEVPTWLRAAVVDAAVELGALGGAVDPRIAAYSVGETATTYRANGNYGFLTSTLRSRLPHKVRWIQGTEDYEDSPGQLWYPIWSGEGWPGPW